MNVLKIPDGPNCETEPANRTLQPGLLFVPTDSYAIKFYKGRHFIVIPGNLFVRIAVKHLETCAEETMFSVPC